LSIVVAVAWSKPLLAHDLQADPVANFVRLHHNSLHRCGQPQMPRGTSAILGRLLSGQPSCFRRAHSASRCATRAQHACPSAGRSRRPAAARQTAAASIRHGAHLSKRLCIAVHASCACLRGRSGDAQRAKRLSWRFTSARRRWSNAPGGCRPQGLAAHMWLHACIATCRCQLQHASKMMHARCQNARAGIHDPAFPQDACGKPARAGRWARAAAARAVGQRPAALLPL